MKLRRLQMSKKILEWDEKLQTNKQTMGETAGKSGNGETHVHVYDVNRIRIYMYIQKYTETHYLEYLLSLQFSPYTSFCEHFSQANPVKFA